MREEDEPFLTFHLEHIVARQHEGPTVGGNLAWACHHCNLHKGTNLAGMDPETGQVQVLFNPRADDWDVHFERRGAVVVGRTPAGRTTAKLLRMNVPERVELRSVV